MKKHLARFGFALGFVIILLTIQNIIINGTSPDFNRLGAALTLFLGMLFGGGSYVVYRYYRSDGQQKNELETGVNALANTAKFNDVQRTNQQDKKEESPNEQNNRN